MGVNKFINCPGNRMRSYESRPAGAGPRANFQRDLNDVVAAQYRRRAKRYDNLEHIAEKYEKYLQYGGDAKNQPPLGDTELDYRA